MQRRRNDSSPNYNRDGKLRLDGVNPRPPNLPFGGSNSHVRIRDSFP